VRTVLVTGPAGAGTTTVASGLAQRLVDEGRRTALIRGQRPGDGPAPTPQEGPTVVDVDALAWGTRMWDALAPARRFVGRPWSELDRSNVLPLPPLLELAWWGALREVWQGSWDAVVVDAGPLDAALRWLTLPDLAVGMLRRTWPLADRTGEAADQLQEGSWHLRAIARVESEAAELADQLRSAATAIHLVVPPRPHELGRVLHALAPLDLFELPVTDLVVNRLHPRRAYDRAVADRLPGQVPALRVRTAPDHRRPPSPSTYGREVYPDLQPAPRPARPRVGRSDGRYVWSWPLSFADPAQVTAVAAGEDLLLTVAGARRVVALPSVLRRCRLQEASFAGNVLQLFFIPNPDVWPENREVP
jgi:arsenite-transporting ATPase